MSELDGEGKVPDEDSCPPVEVLDEVFLRKISHATHFWGKIEPVKVLVKDERNLIADTRAQGARVFHIKVYI